MGERRGKSKLEAGGSSGVGGGRCRGLPDIVGRPGLVVCPWEPPDILRERSNIGEGSFPEDVSGRAAKLPGRNIPFSECSVTASMRLEIEGSEGRALFACSIAAVASKMVGEGREV